MEDETESETSSLTTMQSSTVHMMCRGHNMHNMSPYDKEGNKEDGHALFASLADFFAGGEYNGSCDDDILQQRPLLQEYHARIYDSKVTYYSEFCVGLVGDKWGLSSNAIHGTLELLNPQYLVLLCLQSERFVQADVASLRLICTDFELPMAVQTAVVEWGWQGLYSSLSSGSLSNLEKSYNKVVLQSLIFVSRVYYTMNALNVAMDERLESVVKSILLTIEKEANKVSNSGKKRKEVPGAIKKQAQQSPEKNERRKEETFQKHLENLVEFYRNNNRDTEIPKSAMKKYLSNQRCFFKSNPSDPFLQAIASRLKAAVDIDITISAKEEAARKKAALGQINLLATKSKSRRSSVRAKSVRQTTTPASQQQSSYEAACVTLDSSSEDELTSNDEDLDKKPAARTGNPPKKSPPTETNCAAHPRAKKFAKKSTMRGSDMPVIWMQGPDASARASGDAPHYNVASVASIYSRQPDPRTRAEASITPLHRQAAGQATTTATRPCVNKKNNESNASIGNGLETLWKQGLLNEAKRLRMEAQRLEDLSENGLQSFLQENRQDINSAEEKIMAVVSKVVQDYLKKGSA